MEENARPIIIILCHGESPSIRASPHPSASPSICPFLSHPSLSFTLSFTLLAPVSASTEPAVLLFALANGGSFCFTFILISNDEETSNCDYIARVYVFRRTFRDTIPFLSSFPNGNLIFK